jgi:hypothetical protein
MAMARAQEQDALTISASDASQTVMSEAARRLSSPLVPGMLFQLSEEPAHELPHFAWPLGPRGRQAEAAGYQEAVPWIQKHICPEGVQAVLVDTIKWLDW